MTYTREQSEQMDGFELSTLVAEAMGWVAKYDEWYRPIAYGLERMTDDSWSPAMRHDHSRRVQTEAIKKNPYEYIMQLCAILLKKEYTKSHFYHFNDIIQMFQATPRQITIAAILTLQGEGKSE